MRLFSKIIKYKNYEEAIKRLKSNSGSNTPGVDGLTLKDILKDEDTYNRICKRLQNYKPMGTKRIEIPKSNGAKRPLGIPCIEDRIIQMMFKQILEPICETKFHNYSYGFRPNRNAEHAIAQNNTQINRRKLHFCVDIDIKGFFDNINHKKLLKQCIAIGIKDAKVISIIKEMLKSPITLPNGQIIKPTKGTPQGGILSPLLANICLNELDWWIDRQWDGLKTTHQYSERCKKLRALKKTNLIEVRIIRYADDFKLFCRNRAAAERMFKITKQFLKHRLKLEISKEKSKVINLRKKKSIFLGFSIKAIPKGKKIVAKLHISNKAKKNIFTNLKNTIKTIQRGGEQTKFALKYNSQVRGIQNYYVIATHSNLDFTEIGYKLDRILFNRLGPPLKNRSKINKAYNKRFKGYNFRVWNVTGVTLFTIQASKTRNPMNFSSKNKKSKPIKVQLDKNYEDIYLKSGYIRDTQWNLLRAEAYYKLQGKCYVTGKFLDQNEFEIHHIIPKEIGGKDEIDNLVLLKKDIHKQVHSKNPTIDQKSFPKFSELRNIILNLKLNK